MYLNFKTKKFLLLPLAFFTMFCRADYFPQSDNWEVSSPEVEGISSSKIDKLMEMSFLDKATQAVVVIKNGKIISEKYADGYDMNSHGTSWSMAKSYYAALIGISIDKGKPFVSKCFVMFFACWFFEPVSFLIHFFRTDFLKGLS